ncbi:MAG TPA: ThuA domain-containing protein [Fimbriimonadaceae bacterium]|nr:ThuA domain-containing protein [Fimbriimonadaceae bacterium]HRJ96206.1 ThuA domain-containing protein [Fimbriimonadaceae bacterium]
MDRRALVVWGGWDGHEPDRVADLFASMLRGEGFEVDVSDSLDAFADPGRMRGLSLIVPVVTMSEITAEQLGPVLRAVADEGVGMAGCHGGMCDAFRASTEWQFLTGGQWVAHPGNDGVRYRVVVDRSVPSPITEGLDDFEVVSEQYYLHTDPGNRVLAYTEFPHPDHDGPHAGNACRMPQVWTKSYGRGRVFYNALGHQRSVLEEPVPRELMRRGFRWAAGEMP